jgi:hypothetical protein
MLIEGWTEVAEHVDAGAIAHGDERLVSGSGVMQTNFIHKFNICFSNPKDMVRQFHVKN